MAASSQNRQLSTWPEAHRQELPSSRLRSWLGEGAGESRSPKQLLQAWAGIPRPIPLGLGREDRVYIQKFKVISKLTRDG